MKLRYSLFSRKAFLNRLLGRGLLAFFSSLLYPIVIFFFPLRREPDRVILKR